MIHVLWPMNGQIRAGYESRGAKMIPRQGGIFSSYGRHSVEMPLRLIGSFDQRWRDTPVKNQQPPVPPLSLCIPLFLSLFLPLRCSDFLSPLFTSLTSLYFFCLFSSASLFKTLCLSLMQTYGYRRVRAAVLFPPCSSSVELPRWLLSHAHMRQ